MTAEAPDTTYRLSSGPQRSLRRRWIEAGLIVFFWSAVALLTLGREILSPHKAHLGLREGEALHAVLEIGVWALITPFIFWVTPHLLPDRVGWFRTVTVSILLGVVVAVVVDLIDHLLWNTLVPDGGYRPVSVQVVLSNFHFLNEFFVYIALLVAGFGRAYFLRYQEHHREAMQLRMDAARLQTHLAEARLRALRMQINPHFLFNTLHIISDHFEEDPRTARRMIARLSDILRYTFEGTETREVPLREELQFLDGYLDIQRFRFEDRLDVKIDVSDEALEALVPTLILQPLVENAIKHGVNQIEAQGIIAIRAWRDGENLHIRVADNGPGQPQMNGQVFNTKGIGLRNTRERLETLYGPGQRFSAESPPVGGFVAYMVLPYHTSSDYFLSSVEQ